MHSIEGKTTTKLKKKNVLKKTMAAIDAASCCAAMES